MAIAKTHSRDQWALLGDRSSDTGPRTTLIANRTVVCATRVAKDLFLRNVERMRPPRLERERRRHRLRICSTIAISILVFGCDHAITRVLPSLSYTQVTAGQSHVCALLETGAAYCWGGPGPQLGIGQSYAGTSTPQLVQAAPGVLFTSISAGRVHTCALTRAGPIYCWGANTYGSVGDSTSEVRSTPVPIRAPDGVTFSAVTAGYEHSCALATTGTAYCWGAVIVDGVTSSYLTPTAIVAPPGVTFTALSAGARRTCGLTSAGAAYCMGVNTHGGVGDGTTEDRWTPTLVQTPAGVSFVAISAAYEHACGVTASGVVYCWGDNEFGSLGDGSGKDQLTPVPIAAPPGVSFTAISVDGYHSCALTTAGSIYCWGDMRVAITYPTTPTLVASKKIASIALGERFACVLSVDGAVSCWGDTP